jgi:Flp pilus assembly protein TadD
MPPAAAAQSILPALEAAANCFRNGNLSEAGRFCETVLDAVPGEANALHILGIVRLRQGDPRGAVSILERAARAAPGNPEILSNLGAAHRANGSAVQASRVLRKAVRMAPDSQPVHFNLANALADAGDAEGAERHYRHVLKASPAHGGAHRGLAALLASEGRSAEALDLYQSLAALEPDDPSTLNAIGAIHAEKGNFDAAGAELRRALELSPSNADIAANLANVCACQFRHAAAAPLYARAISERPECADLLSNAGNGYMRGGRDAEALECFRRALDLDPRHPEANAGLANFLLSRGEYAEGWQAYLTRSSIQGLGPGLFRDRLPSYLGGKRITVVADQGLGDEIFFLRFADALRRRGAHVTYRPEIRLGPMIARAGIVDEIMAHDGIPRGDYILAVGDLPYALGMEDGDEPPPSVSLAPLDEKRERLLSVLEAFGPRPWIGATWRAGTPNIRRLLFKEIDYRRLAPVLARTQGTVVAIQRGARDGEVRDFEARVGRPILDLSAVNDDVEDMLALAGLLDRYVAVSNTMVHMRAACGGASEVLVPIPSDFRWMASGNVSAWFPRTRVNRQQADGDWKPALASIASRLGG